ncbi:ATP-dependent nuclease [Photorhabdus noenieputensis]|uniref:ATP-dependent nuclease n=1 Tax=Photorhabdus noenieputensis TaxID=1208607 RepID=UPI001BD1F282|nr:AAA family ATPase [Photorhabdus noenieputensis]MCK3669203.1 AAA family ATPase [Photorhabdus noenieputensis]
MYLSEIAIKNFRLLEDISIKLEKNITLIVGRNNSGKTSFTHLLGYVFSDKTPKKLTLCDFSISCIEIFKKIAFCQKEISVDRILSIFPQITIDLVIDYSDNQDDYPVSLLPFLIDIEAETTLAKIKASYNIPSSDNLLEFISNLKNIAKQDKEAKATFLDSLSELIQKYYSWSIVTINPNDKLDIRSLDFSKLSSLICGYFISAQRSLGDYQSSEKDSIGSVIKSLITKRPESEKSKSALAKELNITQGKLTQISQQEIDKMIPKIAFLGSDHTEEITVDVQLNINNFSPHLSMNYLQGNCGMKLPEHYNGLGRRNLLLISIKLVEYIQDHKFNDKHSDINIIFIEEPEAYFHPQMQETFIKMLFSYKEELEKEYLKNEKWPVQFIITTHSPHIANKENFQNIRYFKSVNDTNINRKTIIKDLSLFSESSKNLDFLRQYLTLTVCDLFFADKLVLVEGSTERILFPKLVKLFEEEKKQSFLSSQYIATLEIGGVHADTFYNLIDFLQIPALIITDLDSINSAGKTCCVSKGKSTSNYCIKNWFKNNTKLKYNGYSPSSLIKCKSEEKINGYKKITYQIPEKEDLPCGRSFESALMLANLDLLNINETDVVKLEEIIWNKTQNLNSKKKIALAFEYAFKKDNWNIPKYIKEGLTWLEQQGVHHDND